MTGPDDMSGLEKAFDNLANAFSGGGKTADATTSDIANAFFRAVKSKNLKTVRKYLEENFNPNTYTDKGDTALHIAARAGSADMINLLIDFGADPTRGKKDEPAFTPMSEAINFGKSDAAAVLAQRGGYAGHARSDAPGWTPLHESCEKGKTALVDAFMKAGADGNEMTDNGSTPLIIAVARMKAETAEKLLEFESVVRGMNHHVNKTDDKARTAIHWAVGQGLVRVVSKMAAKGADINRPDSDGFTPVYYAIDRADLDMVRTLVTAHADINKSTATVPTALLHAIKSDGMNETRKKEIVSYLLRAGADPDIAAQANGNTALIEAVTSNAGSDVIAALLEYKPDLNARNHAGENALTIAVRQGYLEYADMLLAAGADANGRDGADFSTPLIAAVQKKQTALVGKLLKSGADPALCDVHRRSALSYARANNDNAVIKLLEEALAPKIPSSKPRPNRS